jgi:hypothetical protein
MKARTVLLIFIFSGYPLCQAQRPSVEDALASGLRWRYRWIDKIPDTQKIECMLALFEKLSFTHCGGISLSIDLETPDPDPPHVTSIVHEDIVSRGHWQTFAGIAIAMVGNWDRCSLSPFQRRCSMTVK